MNPPMPDPVIDEIREIRHRISASCDHDPAKLVAYLMQYQEQFRDRLIYDPTEQPAAQQAVQPDTDKAAASRPATPVLNS
ncbi:MAG: hypothetical protein ABL888_22505 [Pirellulaceae bacterium]